MTPEERKEAERKKEAKRLAKLPVELRESTEALPEEPAIRPKRTRRNK